MSFYRVLIWIRNGGIALCALAVYFASASAGVEAEQLAGENEVIIVKVVREGAPLYRRADGSSEIARMATIGEEFPRIDQIRGFLLVKDEVFGGFLYLDPLDGVLTKNIVEFPEEKAYIRSPDEDWFWLETSFFIIEDEKTDRLHSGRYNPNREYFPMADPRLMVSEAMKYMGVKYVWGGESMKGLDCSGLVLKCLNAQGFKIVHKASVQAKYGMFVPFDNIRAGDVLFFYDKKKNFIGHTGIYMGGGKFIHAASSLGKVGISDINEKYYRERLVLARRY